MTDVALVKMMQEIKIAYGSRFQDLTNDVLEVWYKHFKDCTESIMTEVTDYYIKNNPYPPTIADLYQAYWKRKREHK